MPYSDEETLNFEVGDNVLAEWSGEWCPATIVAIHHHGKAFDVNFDDDDEDDIERLPARRVRPTDDDSSSSSSEDEAQEAVVAVAAVSDLVTQRAKVPKSFTIYSHRDRVIVGDDDQFSSHSDSIDNDKDQKFVVEFVNDETCEVYIQSYKTGKYWGRKTAESHFLGDKPDRLAYHDVKNPNSVFLIHQTDDVRYIRFQHVPTGLYVKSDEKFLHENQTIDSSNPGAWEKFKIAM